MPSPSQQVRVPPPAPIAAPALPPLPLAAPDETDTLGGRLQWALALAGLITLSAGEVWAVKWAIDLGWPCVAWIGMGALAGTAIAGFWVGQKIRAVWRRDARLEADHEMATATGLAVVETAYATMFDAMDAYAASQFRMRRRRARMLKVTDGEKVYWLDDTTGRVWRRIDGEAAGDNTNAGDGGGMVERPTNQLPGAPPLPALTTPQAAFLARLYSGQAYGAGAVVGKLITRPEYDAVTGSFVAAGILIPNPGKTFALPPALANWREAWPGANRDEQSQIQDRAVEWARRQLAGL